VCFCFIENPADAAIRSLTLGFEVPRNFNNIESYRPSSVDEAIFRAVPNVVASAIVDAIDQMNFFDPLLPFSYLRNGLLPEFVVVHFMTVQKNPRISNQTRFYRAMWLIELYREYLCGAGVGPEEGDLDDVGEPKAGPSGLQKP
jgi:hypothetical protein